jgi:hypothetical protein
MFDRILAERIHQDEKHGGPGHDDFHVSEDWLNLIEFWTRKACYRLNQRRYLDAREAFVKTAALAVAAGESAERNQFKAEHKLTREASRVER